MNIPNSIKDILYFDIPKSISIYSQIDQGIITQSIATDESGSSINSSIGVNLKFLEAKIGGDNSGKEGQSITRIPHHDLLNKLQYHIFQSKSCIDLDSIDINNIEDIYSQLEGKSFIKATGWVNIEDYDRLSLIAQRFNSIARFIQECSLANTEDKGEYEKVRKELEAHKRQTSQNKDRNAKAKDTARIAKLEEDLEKLMDGHLNKNSIPEYLVEGVQNFVSTFLPNRINFRFYPYESLPTFEILSNLKREHFVETDIENIIFSYGSRPNLKMTVFGLISSLPRDNEELFDPLKDEIGTNEHAVFEKAFRGVFRGFEGIEQFVRYSNFPRITINPLAIYREIKL